MTDEQLDQLAKKVADEIVVRILMFLQKLEAAVNEQKES